MPRDEKYLETLLGVLEADKKQLMLFVGFELAIPILTIKDLALGKNLISGNSGLSDSNKLLLVGSLLCFLVAALLHFRYLRRVHANTFAVARFLLDGTGEDARKLLFDSNSGLWAKHGWNYNLAMFFLYLACAGYFVVLAAQIF